MIFTRDFVTRENYWQIASLVTQKSLFTVTYALFFICLIGYHCLQVQKKRLKVEKARLAIEDERATAERLERMGDLGVLMANVEQHEK